MTKQHIVIVEDDTEISRLMTMLFECENFVVTQVFRGDLAVEHVKKTQPDIVILDIMLPGLNGIQVCERLRVFYSGPILMLTGSDNDIYEISSFKKGADDFVNKPFDPSILVARIKALLRRCNVQAVDRDSITTANLSVYFKRREANINGQLLELTTSEYDILSLLANNIGEIVSREMCCAVLRGLAYDGFDRSIDMKISSLRKKLNKNSEIEFIKTVRGKGYMLIQLDQTNA